MTAPLSERSIGVHMEWTPVATSEDENWYFGSCKRISKQFKDLILGPQVYRFVFTSANSNPHKLKTNQQIYVGESGEFERRCAAYKSALTRMRQRQPSQEAIGWRDPSTVEGWKEMQKISCVRIASYIQNAMNDHWKVELQLLKFSEFSLNNIQISPARMKDTIVRRLIENIAILLSDVANITILNVRNDKTHDWFHNKQNEVMGHCKQLSPITDDVLSQHLRGLGG